jgi:hypothetical protein
MITGQFFHSFTQGICLQTWPRSHYIHTHTLSLSLSLSLSLETLNIVHSCIRFLLEWLLWSVYNAYVSSDIFLLCRSYTIYKYRYQNHYFHAGIFACIPLLVARIPGTSCVECHSMDQMREHGSRPWDGSLLLVCLSVTYARMVPAYSVEVKVNGSRQSRTGFPCVAETSVNIVLAVY